MNTYIIPGLIREVEQAVSQVWELPVERIKARTRKREVVEARQVSMWWRANHTGDTMARIGDMLGGYDHATVVHARKTVEILKENDKYFREKFNRVVNIMQAQRKIKIKHDEPE